MNRSVSASASFPRPRAAQAARQAGLFVVLTLAQTMAIALALPHAGIAPLLAIATPTIAVVLVIVLATPPGERSAAWAGIGFHRPPWRGLVIAVAVPAALTVLSFGAAAAIGVARFPNLAFSANTLVAAAKSAVAIAIFAVVFLGEEIGWRGYLLPRLTVLMSGRAASLLTGAFHAIICPCCSSPPPTRAPAIGASSCRW